jgi:hypothetical protein
LDWLLQSAFDLEARVALWSILGVAVTTLLLFAYTMALRATTIRAARRHRRLMDAWRDVFATAALDGALIDELEIPSIARRDEIGLVEEWNRIHLTVSGDAARNLNALARRVGIDHIAGRLFHRRNFSEKILAIQALGHLRDRGYRDAIQALVDDESTALSITAALALVEIDPNLAVGKVIPRINERRDWPRMQVSLVLRKAGSERISEPLYRALRAADDRAKTYLLQFASLVEAEVLEALVVELIRESSDPGVLNAALKLVSGFNGVPRISELALHETWFVRMQAAKVLGRLGEREHVGLLERLLEDREWWVRYRAAQALVALPFLGPNALRRIQRRQTDRYAVDILDQAFAEVGIA